jgi:hypothetical protein
MFTKQQNCAGSKTWCNNILCNDLTARQKMFCVGVQGYLVLGFFSVDRVKFFFSLKSIFDFWKIYYVAG